MKLHLGCGGVHLDGYRNIDLPPDEHGIQEGIEPDEFADITALSYAPRSIEEVRLHHVFEHFERPVAVRLLIDWYEWLAPGGRLVIETPDFLKCARAMLWKRSSASQMKLLRHIFGSHEARWAVHCEGWYPKKFELFLSGLGFENVSCDRSSWKGTYNVTATAVKPHDARERAELERIGDELLALSLVDRGPSELRILEVWKAGVREKSARG